MTHDKDRIRELEDHVNHLNSLLRAAGWGQGEIDNAAIVVDEVERLVSLFRELDAELDGVRLPASAAAVANGIRQVLGDIEWNDDE